MNYQHSYHAGCIADVFKHIVLIQLVKTFLYKPSAFSYIETHAGNAFYDLTAKPAQKTLEFEAGIAKLLLAKDIQNESILEYINLIDSLQTNAHHSLPHPRHSSDCGNPSGKNRRWIPAIAGMTREGQAMAMPLYPGSSLFARQFLREQDEELLCELHPDVYENLYNFYRRDKHVHVHQRNGYEAFTALLPPKNKRGLVFIDPPFEITDEYQHIINALNVAKMRWPTGMYAIWFPIKQYEIILDFYQALKKLSFSTILSAEFWAKLDSEDNRVKGSGMVIINPPWQFDILLEDLLPALSKNLDIEKEGKTKIVWVAKQ